MSRHHPSAETLVDYARGGLHAGAALVVACHLEGCAVCRREVSLWEDVGGTLLQAADPAPLSDAALERALARIEAEPAPQHPRRRLPHYLTRFDITAPLREQDIGARRWLTPGIWFAPLRMEADSRSRTYLVYAKQNTTLPQHTHAGREFTLILHGSYCDTLGQFEAGDFAETDDAIFHAPAVTPASDCLCLISADGPMRLVGLPARMIQALAGNLY